MKSKYKNLITKEMGQKILNLFKSSPEWVPTEVPWDSIKGLGLARKDDTIAIFISGSCSNPLLSKGVNAIAGIDVLTIETKPKLHKSEPTGNAYHYIIQETNNIMFPFLLLGPFDKGTIISHWFDETDFDVYLKKNK